MQLSLPGQCMPETSVGFAILYCVIERNVILSCKKIGSFQRTNRGGGGEEDANSGKQMQLKHTLMSGCYINGRKSEGVILLTDGLVSDCMQSLKLKEKDDQLLPLFSECI